MLVNSSIFNSTTALWAVVAVIAAIVVLAILGRTGTIKLPFLSASVQQKKTINLGENLEAEKIRNMIGAEVKGENTNDEIVVGKNAKLGSAEDIIGVKQQ